MEPPTSQTSSIVVVVDVIILFFSLFRFGFLWWLLIGDAVESGDDCELQTLSEVPINGRDQYLYFKPEKNDLITLYLVTA